MHNKRKIIMIGCVVIVVIFLFIILINKNGKKKADLSSTRSIVIIQDNQIANEDIQKMKEGLQQEFEEAIQISKEEYEKYGNMNFDIYFEDSFISDNMIEGRVNYISKLFVDSEEPRKIEIYNTDGKQLEEFPIGRETYNKPDSIEMNKDYLIRLSSYGEEYSFYYIMNINRNCQINLQEVCYTIGEEIPVRELNLDE